MAYDVEGMRTGAGLQQGAADAAAGIARMLGAAGIEASVFGAVSSVEAFAGAAVAARDAQVRGADAESARRADLEVRASTAARVAELLTAQTADQAAGGRSGPGLPLIVGPPG
jgi:hypothetical protein